jgi:hypothetical protein
MRVASENILNRLSATPAAMLRAGCVALLVGVSGCGGGADSASTPSATPAPESGTTQPPQAPSTLVVGTPLTIDRGASGTPVELRVMRGANGDGFAVWQASRPEDVPNIPSLLWANRYRAATGAWGSPVNLATSAMGRGDFDLTLDPGGNAVVAWRTSPADPNTQLGAVMSARFDASTGAWAAPVLLNSNAAGPRLASDASGAVLIVYAVVQAPSTPAGLNARIKGRFFNRASGAWQPETAIEQNHLVVNSATFQAQPLLDGSGNALVAFATGVEPSGFEDHTVASNYYSRDGGAWGELPPDDHGLLGVVPGTGVGSIQGLQLVATTNGNFLAAWRTGFGSSSSFEIAIARFTSRTRTWTAKQALIPGDSSLVLHRIGSDARGNVHLTWTEWDGTRTALKAARLEPGAVSCNAVQTIDRAVGGHVPFAADLAVDPRGDAIAIWDSVQGDQGSEAPSNIAINRFDRSTGAWARAVLVEGQADIAFSSRRPSASASGGQALLGWIQPERGVNRVKVLLQPLADTPSQ